MIKIKNPIMDWMRILTKHYSRYYLRGKIVVFCIVEFKSNNKLLSNLIRARINHSYITNIFSNTFDSWR